jgi:hypothetical protein
MEQQQSMFKTLFDKPHMRAFLFSHVYHHKSISMSNTLANLCKSLLDELDAVLLVKLDADGLAELGGDGSEHTSLLDLAVEDRCPPRRRTRSECWCGSPWSRPCAR